MSDRRVHNRDEGMEPHGDQTDLHLGQAESCFRRQGNEARKRGIDVGAIGNADFAAGCASGIGVSSNLALAVFLW